MRPWLQNALGLLMLSIKDTGTELLVKQTSASMDNASNKDIKIREKRLEYVFFFLEFDTTNKR